MNIIHDLGYVVTPFIAWGLAGAIKFIVNSVKAGALAFDKIGYGGLPSNHSAIVSSVAALVALREGVAHPAFGVAVALCFIVMLDAASLRRHIGKHAQALNRLRGAEPGPPLRERMGHTRTEIAAGIAVGVATASLVNWAGGI